MWSLTWIQMVLQNTENNWANLTSEPRNVGESSCNSGDRRDQRVQNLMFMMMIISSSTLHFCTFSRMITFSYLAWKCTNSLTNTPTQWPAHLYDATNSSRYQHNFPLLQRPLNYHMQALGHRLVEAATTDYKTAATMGLLQVSLGYHATIAPAYQSAFVCHLWAANHNHRFVPATVMFIHATLGAAVCFLAHPDSFVWVAATMSLLQVHPVITGVPSGSSPLRACVQLGPHLVERHRSENRTSVIAKPWTVIHASYVLARSLTSLYALESVWPSAGWQAF